MADVGAAGSVDCIASFARIRESRLSLLDVTNLGRNGDWPSFGELFNRGDDFCALIAPALRSFSLRCPLASIGVSFAREEQVLLAAVGGW